MGTTSCRIHIERYAFIFLHISDSFRDMDIPTYPRRISPFLHSTTHLPRLGKTLLKAGACIHTSCAFGYKTNLPDHVCRYTDCMATRLYAEGYVQDYMYKTPDSSKVHISVVESRCFVHDQQCTTAHCTDGATTP